MTEMEVLPGIDSGSNISKTVTVWLRWLAREGEKVLGDVVKRGSTDEI